MTELFSLKCVNGAVRKGILRGSVEYITVAPELEDFMILVIEREYSQLSVTQSHSFDSGTSERL